MNGTKPFYESKTFWFNVVTLVILVAEFLGDAEPTWQVVTAAIAGVGNIVLRVWFTDTSIG